MTVVPVRPISAAEAALRVELAPPAGQVVRPAEVPPVISPQGAVADHVELRLPTTQPTAPGQAPADPTPAQAVKVAAQSAAARQGALGPLLADLAQVLRIATTPMPVKVAAAQALAAQPQLGPAPTARELRTAVARSGLFLEAHLADALQPEADGHPARATLQALAANAAVRGDAKAALLAFRETVKTWLAGQDPVAPPPHAPLKTPPAPPYPQGPTAGQAPAGSTLPPDAPPAAVAQRLMQEANGALARQELLQMASLPDASPAAANSRNWMFEIPLATPQGPAVAQFEVSRDGGGGSGSAAEAQPVWRARFSLDVEPLGPVHAHVSLKPGHTNVTLWAEREDAAQLLRGEGDALVRTLRRNDMAVDFAVLTGTPKARAAAAGQFVDEAS